jgi:hypothetical protein
MGKVLRTSLPHFLSIVDSSSIVEYVRPGAGRARGSLSENLTDDFSTGLLGGGLDSIGGGCWFIGLVECVGEGGV